MRDRLHTANGNTDKIFFTLAEYHALDKIVANVSGIQGTAPKITPVTTSATQAIINTEQSQTALPTNEKYCEVVDGEKEDINDGFN